MVSSETRGRILFLPLCCTVPRADVPCTIAPCATATPAPSTATPCRTPMVSCPGRGAATMVPTVKPLRRRSPRYMPRVSTSTFTVPMDSPGLICRLAGFESYKHASTSSKLGRPASTPIGNSAQPTVDQKPWRRRRWSRRRMRGWSPMLHTNKDVVSKSAKEESFSNPVADDPPSTVSSVPRAGIACTAGGRASDSAVSRATDQPCPPCFRRTFNLSPTSFVASEAVPTWTMMNHTSASSGIRDTLFNSDNWFGLDSNLCKT
mmetsp:Transcript_105395/g.296849  ORF Transcript_105395/g.296849 Transcript_105395/m.296849 type:complete len:262 (+) Transcript_105395:237-1022(+)